MEQLNKNYLESGTNKELPEKIIQFGEGNFLRGFVDWMVHKMNTQGLFNGKIVAIQPTPHGKVVPKLNRQDGLFTLAIRGISNGEVVESNEIITSISRGINPYTNWNDVLQVAEDEKIRFIFSNTTEAGLTYAKEEYNEKESPFSFPGKITAFLYHRFKTMEGRAEAGMTIIPCELVEDNGDLLKNIVLQISQDWNLPQTFVNWIHDHNQFCNTLVDRIVTGYPTDQIEEFRKILGYEDELLTTGEPYHLFAVDADESVAKELPFQQAGLNVKWGDVTPYRELKVRLLNGPHTMMFSACYLTGANTVLEAMENTSLREFVEKGLFNEILPTVEMVEEEKQAFVHSVIERFLNPYNRHFLTDIGMNAVYKFKARLIPVLEAYIKREGTLPKVIVFSLASLIVYYRPIRKEGAFLIGKRGDEEYTIRDNEEAINLFANAWEQFENNTEGIQKLVQKVLSQPNLWGRDLTKVEGLIEMVVSDVEEMLTSGMKQAIEKQC